MADNKLTGIYFSDPTNSLNSNINSSELESYAQKLPKVVVTWNPESLDISDCDAVVQQIKDHKLNRIIIAGQEPGEHKGIFARAMAKEGLDPQGIILASFQEYDAQTTDLAKSILVSVYHGVHVEAAVEIGTRPVHKDTLVIGAGIAGIQSSLEIANAGYKVHLLERKGTIGGHMAMFDKTFPTLDCAACILTPKMVEVGQHPNINLITYSTVTGISGEPGNFKVKILKKARRVNEKTCIGCGSCAEKCPGHALSEFDSNTTERKAIYIPFPQAVPNKYLIDPESCVYVQKGKCGVCVKVCPVAKCIDLDEKDKEIEITVGNIVVATGFNTFDAKKTEQFGYGKYPNVLTSIELERLINASGPTAGEIVERSKNKFGNWIYSPDSEKPKSVALIHCVGSRDVNHNKYCSRVCCMYSLKLAHLVKEKMPDAEVYEYYIDMRAYGKGYEEFYNRIKKEGVRIIRGRTAKIEEKEGQLILRSEDVLKNEIIEQPIDMAVLAVGLEPQDDAKELSEILGISIGKSGWFRGVSSHTHPVNTRVSGITIAGVCQGPKDIPDSVVQGSAAASRVIQSLNKGKINTSSSDVVFSDVESRAKELSTL